MPPVAATVVMLLPPLSGLQMTHATTMRPVSLQKLTEHADMVVQGVALERESVWVGQRIFTRVRVRATDVWVGAAEQDDVLQVWRLGGVVDDLGQRVPGAAQLPRGKELVLFLTKQNGRLRCVGMSQGVLNIETELGVRVPIRPPGQPLQGGSQPLPKTIEQLKALVRGYADADAP